MSAVLETIPLARDEQGVFRVGSTRVTLDSVIEAFVEGATAEQIVQEFESLDLPGVYQVIGYYLRHRRELDEYLAARSTDAETLLRQHRPEWQPAGLRARLLERRKSR